MATTATRWGLRMLALAAGAVPALAYPAVGAWWLAWVGLVPTLLLLARAGSYREAVWRSWLAAVGFFVVVNHWVLIQLGVFAIPAGLLAGLVWIPVGLTAHGLLRRPTAARVLLATLIVPSVWVTIEVLRSWQHLGGAWALLGNSQWTRRSALAVAALGGVWLLSFLLVAVNVALAAVLLRAAPNRARLVGAAAAVLLAGGTLAWGALRPEPAGVGRLRVAGVQPGVIHDEQERIEAHLRLTRELAGRADVIVWGQSSVAVDPKQDQELDGRLREAARETGADLLINVDAGAPGEITKSTYHYTGEGLIDVYDKQRLVPFGEYIPLRPILGWIADLTPAADTDREVGDELTVFDLDGVPAGVIISYESTFPDMRRELVRTGARVTVVQGSLTTFQNTWAHAQQASVEAIRAVESGRPAVLVQMSGTSTAFDADGRRLAWIPPEHRGTFVVDVPLAAADTPYVRLGDWVPLLAGTVTGGTLLVAVARRLRLRPVRRNGR